MKISLNLRLLLLALLMAALVLWVKAGQRTPVQDLRVNLDPAKRTMLYLAEQNHRNSLAAPEPFRRQIVAGAGFQGKLDGFGLEAHFLDPLDMAWDSQGHALLVLDGEGGAVRRVSLDTGQVTTLWTLADILENNPDLPRIGYTRLTAWQGKIYLLGANGASILEVDQGRARALPRPAGGKLKNLIDIAAGGQSLLLLNGADHSVRSLRLADGQARMDTLASLPREGGYNLLCAGPRVLWLASSNTGMLTALDANTGEVLLEPTKGPTLAGMAPLPDGKAIGYNQGKLFQLSPQPGNPVKPVKFFNRHGFTIGQESQPFEYIQNIFKAATRVVADANGEVYVLDRPNKRVVKVGHNHDTASGLDPATNSRGLLGPEYSRHKPQGTNRILWLSHSVFWDPAGFLFSDNLAFGAPKHLEARLNDQLTARWEVMLLKVYGTNFTSFAYPALRKSLSDYQADYLFIFLDLQNFLWFLYCEGLAQPLLYDQDNIPTGVDASLLLVPFRERKYPAKLAKLQQYIMDNHGPGSSLPLMDEKGLAVTARLLRVWNSEQEFRDLLLDIYEDLFRGVKRLCDQKGVRLVVFVAPTTNFMADNEYADAGLGGSEGRYDAIRCHAPIIGKLLAMGIESYDLTYDMLRIHTEFFPFNAPSHHRSYHFHEALAKSVHALASRYGILSQGPLPAAAALTDQDDEPTRPANKIYTPQPGSLLIVHDLWSEEGQGGVAGQGEHPKLESLVEIALRDVHEARKRRQFSATPEFRIEFVWVKGRDEYGDVDFRGMRRLASLTLKADQLEEAARLRQAGDWAGLKALLRYAE